MPNEEVTPKLFFSIRLTEAFRLKPKTLKQVTWHYERIIPYIANKTPVISLVYNGILFG